MRRCVGYAPKRRLPLAWAMALSALVEQHHSVMLGLRGLFRRPVDDEPANRCRSLSDVDIFLLQAHGFARTTRVKKQNSKNAA